MDPHKYRQSLTSFFIRLTTAWNIYFHENELNPQRLNLVFFKLLKLQMHVAENAKWPSSETRFKWDYCQRLHQIRRSLRVIVCLLICQWQWSWDFPLGKNDSFHFGNKHKDLNAALPFQWSNCLIQRESHSALNEIIGPNFKQILLQIGFCFCCSCDLNHTTGNWPNADWRHLLWPWSGVIVLFRHPLKSQIRSGVLKVTFLDKESRASDTSSVVCSGGGATAKLSYKNEKTKKTQRWEGHD